jgi:photosystem II stability/assembly factor-like uncharacterized protein
MTFRFKSHASQTRDLFLLLILLVLMSAVSFGQQPQAPIKYKGIWEPVSYPDDLKWFDVFFTTADEGWVVGGMNEISGGLIIHTNDGGDHWDVQYGDPQSSDRAVTNLRFLDQTHGWAVQASGGAGSKLLHTRDGKLWLLAGTIDVYTMDYMFTSETHGVQASRDVIRMTEDGGRSWKPVFNCALKVQVNGLFRNINCQFQRLQFVTPSVAYVVAKSLDAPKNLFLAKSTDGGASWAMTTQELTGGSEDEFFFDENTGYIRAGFPDSGQIYKTADGGQTWTGMAASPGRRLQFADPEVGWSLLYNKVSFTTDSGDHWNSRQYAFPAQGRTFSLPRRDRGYVVGDHGMIYRYRIVPDEYVSKGMLPAPLLSGINSPLDVYVQKLAVATQRIASDAGVQPMSFMQDVGGGGSSPGVSTASASYAETTAMAGNSAASPNAATAGSAAVTDSTTTAMGAPATSPNAATATFSHSGAPAGALNAGFSQDVGSAEASFNTISKEVPNFTSKYRNLNLLLAGFAMSSQMPNQITGLKQSFQSLKNTHDPQAMTAAVSDMQTKVMGLFQMVRMAFQKKGAPPASSFQQSVPGGSPNAFNSH